MTLSRAVLYICVAAVLSATPAFATKSNRTAGGHKTSTHSKAHAQARGHKMHGQQAIEPERVTQIQQALVREHYLGKEPDGVWDASTQAAMQKYQSDQGWQTRLIPDSRALVKLGLGPDYSSAINARDVASAPAPPPAGAIPSQQAAGFAVASGVNR